MTTVLKITAIAVLLLVGGCEQPQPRIGPSGFSDGTVSLWVANSPAESSRFSRPRVKEAALYVNGERSDAAPKITAFDSKLGWSERVDFPAPRDAKVIKVTALVRTGGRNYAVTQEWQLVEGQWRPQKKTVTPRD
jgi:hypothetical protein